MLQQGSKLPALSKQSEVFKVPETLHGSMLPNLPFKEVYNDSDKIGKNSPSFRHLLVSINKFNT